MGRHLMVIRRLREHFSLFPRFQFLRSGTCTSKAEIVQLMDIRKSIERPDRSTLSRITCRPMQYRGPWNTNGDSPLPPELFLPGCMIPVSKELDDIIRTERAEER